MSREVLQGTPLMNWTIPHFEKMLYDNAQFVSLISKYLKLNPNKYFERKN